MKIIFTDEHHFQDFWNVDDIAGSEKLMLGYKQTASRSHDFRVNTIIYTLLQTDQSTSWKVN